MYFRQLLNLIIFSSILAALPCMAKDYSIGSINTMKGNAVIIRNGEEISARLGDSLMALDVLKTSKNSTMGIILRDNTTVSLGARSTLGLKEFVFNPKDGISSMVINMVQGKFVYISGKMGTLYPDSIKLETPVGTVAVRGTKLMAKIE